MTSPEPPPPDVLVATPEAVARVNAIDAIIAVLQAIRADVHGSHTYRANATRIYDTAAPLIAAAERQRIRQLAAAERQRIRQLAAEHKLTFWDPGAGSWEFFADLIGGAP
jgi:hypothetical protein